MIQNQIGHVWEVILKKTMQGFLLISILCCTVSVFGGTIEHIGSYNGWDDLTWRDISSLNDPNDGIDGTLDFVGDSNDTGAYWADNGSYIFFRFRLDIGTVDDKTFRDSHFLLIDVDDYLYGSGFGNDDIGLPDFGFAWDSKSNDPDKHGLEMLHISTTDNLWNGINMDDIDGNAGGKGTNDINGEIGSTGTYRDADGYVRTIDEQGTTAFGSTTLMDIAVSWDYLETYTDLARGQTWNVALASLANATDHNNLTGDIGGGANPTNLRTEGWASLGVIPEPTVISLLSLSGLTLLIGRRVIQKD